MVTRVDTVKGLQGSQENEEMPEIVRAEDIVKLARCNALWKAQQVKHQTSRVQGKDTKPGHDLLDASDQSLLTKPG